MTGKLETQNPAGIEKRSFEIITKELGDRHFSPEQEPVIKRVIHTTADFDYADSLYFSPEAVEKGIAAIREGAHIVTDTNMAYSGVSKKTLEGLGGEAHCFMADADVAKEARERGVTRAVVCMERAALIKAPLIIAVGNAPTALLRLCQLMEEGKIDPRLIIGVPVGFVNVVESKEEVIASKAPCIVARGRKGGSNVAAAICNALLYQASGRVL